MYIVNRSLVVDAAAGVVWGAMLAATPVSAAVVFDFGFVNASTDNSLSGGKVALNDSRFQQTSALPSGGLAALSVLMVTGGAKTNPDFANSMSSTMATFAPDGAAGKFVFSQTTDTTASQPASLSAYSDSTGTAFYTFTLTTPAVFSLKYSIETTGRTGAVYQPSQYFSLLDYNTFSYKNTPKRLGASGTYTSPTLASGKYQFTVQNYDVNYSSLFAPGAAATSLNSNFAFSISTVPEPSMWVMMLIGFASVGVSMRRLGNRRRRAAQRLL